MIILLSNLSFKGKRDIYKKKQSLSTFERDLEIEGKNLFFKKMKKMKKILTSTLLSLSLVSLVSAETGTISTWITSTGKISSGTILEVTSATTGSWENALVTPNEATTITYYYGQTCPYCQNLNRYLESVDGYSKLNIDKREVWHNKENAQKMSEDIKRLGLENNANIWVPFLVVNENGKEITLSGLDQAMAYFEPILGKYDEKAVKTAENEAIQKKAEANSNRHIIFLIVILVLAALIPFAFIKKSK